MVEPSSTWVIITPVFEPIAETGMTQNQPECSSNPGSTARIIEQAVEVLKIEAEGILKLSERIDERFEAVVELIYRSRGRMIVSGIGKSGIVGRKIVATLNSTGTRSFFLHPVEAMHGDLGQVSPDDTFLALSNSGETDELNILVPSIRGIGCKVIAFTGVEDSTLAQHSDIVIHVGVEREACPLGLAPTASSTAMMAIGDALAVVLINKNRFKTSDFKRFHPAGKLGLHLSNKVGNIMLTGASIPRVTTGTGLGATIEVMDRHRLGHALVETPDGKLCGVVTDGDLRRMLAHGSQKTIKVVDDIMTPHPRKLGLETHAFDALNLMEQHQITALPIVDDADRIQGIIHLHDLLGKGNFKINGG